jgi:hypothetical protein
MSGFFIVAALVAAACYFGWSALAALRSGNVTALCARRPAPIFFAPGQSGGLLARGVLVPRRRGGLRRGARHSHFMAVKFWGDVSDSVARAQVSRAMI